ncbi:hypothetical protein [Citrobacter koseri]|uniref:hypothetical protein n=1 Tax=Citrobacter koseri TaxID=545 RepID=UPI0028BEA514|nr:hypothetical protein [Citrobacter koseri]MDT7484883.1 hypothetical protein [Citrobacter koseri]
MDIMMNEKIPLLSILALAFFLTGCDSQPSDSDITQAMQILLTKQTALLLQII